MNSARKNIICCVARSLRRLRSRASFRERPWHAELITHYSGTQKRGRSRWSWAVKGSLSTFLSGYALLWLFTTGQDLYSIFGTSCQFARVEVSGVSVPADASELRDKSTNRGWFIANQEPFTVVAPPRVTIFKIPVKGEFVFPHVSLHQLPVIRSRDQPGIQDFNSFNGGDILRDNTVRSPQAHVGSLTMELVKSNLSLSCGSTGRCPGSVQSLPYKEETNKSSDYGPHSDPVEPLCNTQLPFPIAPLVGAPLFLIGTWLNFRSDDFTFHNQITGWFLCVIGGLLCCFWALGCL